MLVFLQVHILADVTSLSVTPSSAGLNVLDEHCMPDRDRIPHASIHYLFTIFKSFVRQFMIYAHFYAFFMCIVHMKQAFHMVRSYVGSNRPLLDACETIFIVGYIMTFNTCIRVGGGLPTGR
jgi:hypothetical protein